MVEVQLASYNLTMQDHIVCSNTDGASVMVKYGKRVDPELQLYYQQTVHMAVTKVIYRPQAQPLTLSDSADESDAEEEDGVRKGNISCEGSCAAQWRKLG